MRLTNRAWIVAFVIALAMGVVLAWFLQVSFQPQAWQNTVRQQRQLSQQAIQLRQDMQQLRQKPVDQKHDLAGQMHVIAMVDAMTHLLPKIVLRQLQCEPYSCQLTLWGSTPAQMLLLQSQLQRQLLNAKVVVLLLQHEAKHFISKVQVAWPKSS